MSWVKDIIGTEKAVIGLCHLKALPGDPFYDEEGGMDLVYEAALRMFGLCRREGSTRFSLQ